MRTGNKRHVLADGIILPDEPFAKKIGFVSSKFDGYLWKAGNQMWVPFIKSVEAGQGNLTKLFAAIEARGYKIYVPTPFRAMQAILMRFGYTSHSIPWESSVDCVIDPETYRSGMIWERHKMGLKMKGLKFSLDDLVEVWNKPEIDV